MLLLFDFLGELGTATVGFSHRDMASGGRRNDGQVGPWTWQLRHSVNSTERSRWGVLLSGSAPTQDGWSTRGEGDAGGPREERKPRHVKRLALAKASMPACSQSNRRLGHNPARPRGSPGEALLLTSERNTGGEATRRRERERERVRDGCIIRKYLSSPQRRAAACVPDSKAGAR